MTNCLPHYPRLMKTVPVACCDLSTRTTVGSKHAMLSLSDVDAEAPIPRQRGCMPV